MNRAFPTSAKTPSVAARQCRCVPSGCSTCEWFGLLTAAAGAICAQRALGPTRASLVTFGALRPLSTSPAMYEAAEYARQGNVDYFKALSGPELQALTIGRDEDGRTLLHTAAAHGYLALVQLLAAHGASRVVSKQDDEGWTPLHSAVSSGQEQVVTELLRIGASVDATTSGGQTPLHYAASKGFVSILRQLLQHGAKVNAKDQTGSTPLHRAASAGKAEAVQVLVEEGGAKVDSKDKTGATPLFVAVTCGESNIAVYLASQGADLEAATRSGQTPLSEAGELGKALQQSKASNMEIEQ